MISARKRANCCRSRRLQGVDFDFDLLQQLTGLNEGALLHAIKELIRAQLVVGIG